VLVKPYTRVRLQNLIDINLAHNTHLRHISLLIYPDEFTEWAFTLLSQSTSLPVERISLRIFSPTHAYLRAVDWARIDRLLTQQRWTKLQRLSVGRIGQRPAEVLKLIRSRLPILESCGVVLDVV
jgi:hypothetical protein